MVAIISSFLRAASLSSLLASTAFATLHSLPAPLIAKRQNPNDTVGTNLYNCHNNCGQAILEEEIAGFCNSTIFSTDYAACLQCSGPDNEDIWQYYGTYLTAGAVECGSATVPLSGTQADVATALIAQNISSSVVGASATIASTSATTTASSSSTTSTSATSGNASTTSASSGASAVLWSVNSCVASSICVLLVALATTMA